MESVKPGKRVVVTKMTSGKVEGKLLSITADSIKVEWRDQPTVVQRPDVFRVRIANIRRRNTLIGMAIGAGVGVAWGANLGDRERGLSVCRSWEALARGSARPPAACCRSGRRCIKSRSRSGRPRLRPRRDRRWHAASGRAGAAGGLFRGQTSES